MPKKPRFNEPVVIRGQNTDLGTEELERAITHAADTVQTLAVDQAKKAIEEKKKEDTEAAKRRAAIRAADVDRLLRDPKDPKNIRRPPTVSVTDGKVLSTEDAEYNRLVIGAYKSSVQNDYRIKLNDIFMENIDNFEGYAETMAGYGPGVWETVDPAIRNEVRLDMEQRIADGAIKVRANERKKHLSDMEFEVRANVESASNAAYDAARVGDPTTAIEENNNAIAGINELRKTNRIDQTTQQDMIRTILRKTDEQLFKGEVLRLSETDGFDDALQRVETWSKTAQEGFTPDEQDKFVQSITGDLINKRNRVNEAELDFKLENQTTFEQLIVDVTLGDKQPDELFNRIDTLFNTIDVKGKRAITATQAAALKQRIFNNLAKKQLKVKSYENVLARLRGDTKQVVSQKEIDAFYDDKFKPFSVDTLPDDMSRNAFNAQFVDLTKRVPTSLGNQISSNLTSRDFQTVIDTVDVIDRLDSIAGIDASYITKNQRAFAERVANLSLTLEPPEAVQLALQLTDPNDQNRLKARNDEIKEWEKATFGSLGSDIDDDVEDILDPSLLSFGASLDTSSRADLRAEVSNLTKEYYRAGMDNSAARAKAKQLTVRNWGVDQSLDRPIFSRFPIGGQYAVAPGEDTEWIGKQLLDDVTRQFIFPFEVTMGDLIIRSDDQTSREISASGGGKYKRDINNRDPETEGFLIDPETGKKVPAITYNIIVRDPETGMINPLPNFRWGPDQDSEIAERRTELAEQEAIKVEEGRRRAKGLPPTSEFVLPIVTPF